jgi:hypothetical protein
MVGAFVTLVGVIEGLRVDKVGDLEGVSDTGCGVGFFVGVDVLPVGLELGKRVSVKPVGAGEGS